MSPRVLRSRPSVCQLCDFIAARHSTRPKTTNQVSKYADCSRSLSTRERKLFQNTQIATNSASKVSASNGSQSGRRNGVGLPFPTMATEQSNFEKDINEVINMRDKLILSSSIPPEEDIRKALSFCEVTADALMGPSDQLVRMKDGSAAWALLSVDEQPSPKPMTKSQKITPATQKYIDQLSDVAQSILVHPSVFISPKILQQFITLQSHLKKPEIFPQIFKLYASKPVPEAGSSPIKYIQQNPNKIANAINGRVAERALQTAIESKQLVAAMDIIDTSYAVKAFRRAKFARKGLLPVTGLTVAPVAAYAVATQLATYQTTMDPGVATNMAFAGILAYVGFTATIGIVAVTTANDQMDRVTWAQGMPLRERWIREEERAAIDKVAGAWGFREKWRRGEEEGEEWDALREWIGRKGMILDRVELMEGME